MEQSLVNLSELNSEKFKQFFNSFETIVTDCDGVIFKFHETAPVIPNTPETITKLHELKKNIRYLTNNSTLGLDRFLQKLNDAGFVSNKDDILYPTIAIIDYLKTIKFDKKIYVIGLETIKNDLTNAGFKVANSGPFEIEEKFTAYIKEMGDDPDIGAVIVDVDVNINFIRLSKASHFLQKPDVLFFAGITDTKIPMGSNFILGPGYFYKMLEDFTGRQAMVFGKPSSNLCQFVKQHFSITDPSTVLFIGDSLYQDIYFAKKCGFKTLLVLTGITTLDEAKNSDENRKPDYYINSLGDLVKLLENKL